MNSLRRTVPPVQPAIIVLIFDNLIKPLVAGIGIASRG